nr:Dbl homology (DH) and Pleckstrin homology and Src homology-3 domain containing protein [Haemonchus contortus]
MAIREPDTSPQPGGSRVRALAHRFETGGDPSGSSDEASVSSDKMMLVVELRKSTAACNQPARTPLVRRRNSHRRRPQSSSEPLNPKTRSTDVMRKSESAHPNICSLEFTEPKPRSVESRVERVRSAKPPPPAKPEGLSQRVKALSQGSTPAVSATTTSLPATRGSAAEHERTEGKGPDEVKTAQPVVRTPSSSRSARPRLAPPPPPPKKPTPTSSPTPPVKPPREQNRISLEQSSSKVLQQLPSSHNGSSSPVPPPSTSCGEGPRPSAPTIPLPQLPNTSSEGNGESSFYESIDFYNESQTTSGKGESDTSTNGDRTSETFTPSSCFSGDTSRHSFSSPGMNTLPRFSQSDGSQSSTLSRKKSSPRYTTSVDFEKFLRIKSNLQQNISKKMDQLRQKVGDKRISAASTPDAFKDGECGRRWDETASEGSPKLNAEDIYVYGDEWSSDDDDDQNVYDDRRSSMYKELEQQLNRVFPTTQSKMESEYEYDTPDYSQSDDQQSRPEALKFAELSNLDEPSPEEEDYGRQYTSRLPTDQPLYQIYMLAENDKLFDGVLLRANDSIERNGGQEEPTADTSIDLFRRESCASSDSGRGADCSTSASALTSNTSMRRERLIATSHFGSQRSLWCELEEVKAAGLLATLDEETRMRQEAYFEVITSEASYLRSLNILITHFMASQELMGSKSAFSVISNSDRKHLFSNIFAVRDCSERLLSDLETRLEQNLVLDDLCTILVQHFESNFDVYIKYCSNQVYQERTLRRLKAENPAFLNAVSRMEADKQCQGLDMRSFLMLPMQRVTRYPLLVYAILDRLQRGCDEYEVATRALHAANKVVGECNEGARRMERTEQLLEVDSRLVYKDPDLKKIALVSNCRYLVKRGSLVQLVERKNRNILQGKQKTRNVYIFLFSDIILITKKKLNGTYECKDYAARRYVDVQPIEIDNERVALTSFPTRPHLFLCVFMRNARGRQAELLLNAESETDRERWLSALRPPISTNPEEKIYAEWDCPQAVAVHCYNKNQDDELPLEVGDMVNVLRKMPDGWFFGQKGSDGSSGWFPSSYVQQILNDHVRANNYRKRLRLIQAASSVSAREGVVKSSSTPLMDRLRRMSNPRFLFQTDVTGL